MDVTSWSLPVGITPLCHVLFALYNPKTKYWYNPNHVFSPDENSSELVHYCMRLVCICITLCLHGLLLEHSKGINVSGLFCLCPGFTFAIGTDSMKRSQLCRATPSNLGQITMQVPLFLTLHLWSICLPRYVTYTYFC